MMKRLTLGLLLGFVVLAAGAGNAAAEAIAIVFLNDTDYVVMDDGVNDIYGQDGIETGTYSWTSGTGAFSASPVVDTTGQWSLSHPVGAWNTTVAGDTLTIADDTGPFSAPRLLPSITNPLVGTWAAWNSHNDMVIATFFDDTAYMLGMVGVAETGPIVGQTGIEFGEYLWNQGTGAFSAPSVITDTNGMWGFSDPLSPMSISVSGDTLTFVDGSQTLQLTRVLSSSTNELVGTWGGYSTSTQVPEPSTLLFLGSALAGLGFARRKFKS